MFEKVNFFPMQYIITIVGVIVGITIFRELIYTFFSSNPTINGVIVFLFFFNMVWLTGVLAYFSRSGKVVHSISLIDQSRRSVSKASNDSGEVEVGGLNIPIVGTIIDTPAMSNAIARLDRRSKLEISKEEFNMVMTTANENIAKALSLSRFLGGIFTMLGLFGTFVGLLQTITGVGNAFAGLAQGGVQVGDLILSLSEPLQGMATAFSTSLFGLVASLVTGYLLYIATTRAKTFISRLSNYLTSRIPIRNYGLSDLSSSSSMETLIELLETGFSSLLGGDARAPSGGYAGDSDMKNVTPSVGAPMIGGGMGSTSLMGSGAYPGSMGSGRSSQFGGPGGAGGGMGGPGGGNYPAMPGQQAPGVPADSGVRMELLVSPLQNLSRSIDVMNASIYRFLSDTNSLFSEALTGITELQSYSLDVYSKMLDSMSNIEFGVTSLLEDATNADIVNALGNVNNGLRSIYDVSSFMASKTSDIQAATLQYLPMVAENTTNTVEGIAYLSEQIGSNFDIAMKYMNSTSSALNQLLGYQAYVAESFDNANSALGSIYDGLGSMFRTLEYILENIGQTNMLMDISNEHLKTTIDLVDGVGTVLIKVSNSLSNLENITTNGFGTLNNTIIAGVNHLSADLTRVSENIISTRNDLNTGFAVMKEGFEASLSGLSAIYSQTQEMTMKNDKFYAYVEETMNNIDKSTAACAYILNGIYGNTNENVQLLGNILDTSSEISSKVSTREDLNRLQGLVAAFASQNLETSMAVNDTIKSVTGALYEQLGNILEVEKGILTGSINAVEEHNDLMKALSLMFANAKERYDRLGEINETVEEGNRLARGAINGLLQAAQMLSSSIDNISSEVADMSSIVRNSLNYESILNNLVENVEDLGKFVGNLGSDIVSLTDAVDAKEDLTNAIVDAMGSVRDLEGGLSSFAGGVTDMADLLAQAVPILGSIADAGDYASDIRDLVSGLVSDMDSLLNGFSGIANDMMDVALNVEKGVENMSFETSEAHIIDMSNTLADMSRIMESALSLLPEINDTILENVDYRGILEVMREEVGDLAQSVADLTDSIETSVADVSEFFGDGMSDTVRMIEEGVAEMANAVEEMANVVLSGADLESGLGNVSDTMSMVGDLMEDLINVLADIQGTAVDALETQRDNVAILDSLDRVNENLEDVSQGLYDNSVREEVEAIIDLADNMNRSLNDVSSSIRENSNLSAESVTAMLPLIENVVSSVAELNDRLSEATDVLGTDTGAVADMMSEMSSVVQEVASSMRDIGETIRSTDIDTLQELVEGMKDIIYSVDELSGNLAQAVSLSLATASNGEDMVNLLAELRDEVARGNSERVNGLGSVLQSNLDSIVRELLTAVKGIKPSSSKEREYGRILSAVDRLGSIYSEGNARMDVVANALDAVITEMLNSREITESILRTIARPGMTV